MRFFKYTFPFTLIAFLACENDKQTDSAEQTDNEETQEVELDPNDPGLVGAWKTTSTIEEMELDFTLTLETDGSCLVAMGNLPEVINCTWTTNDGTFLITDEECEETQGEYIYTITDNTVNFELVSDGCTDRASVLNNTWTSE